MGGDSEAELRATQAGLEQAGLRLMVCPAMEEDEGEGGGDEKYDWNAEYIGTSSQNTVVVSKPVGKNLI